MGFYMGMLGFVMIGCQGEFTHLQADSKDVENCLESKGEYDFTDNICYCGGLKCPSGNSCIKENSDEDKEKFVCAECSDDKKKCDGNKLLSCVDKKWDIDNPKICDFGCDSDNEICFECLYENKDTLECVDGDIYQCKGGYYALKETCMYGCNKNNTTCNKGECINDDKKCIESGDDAVVLTCKNGFWPTENGSNESCESEENIESCKCDSEKKWKDSDVVKVHCNKSCHLTEPRVVECNKNRCMDVTRNNLNKMDCNTYKSIILGFMKELSKLNNYDRFNEQLDDWFEWRSEESETTICEKLDSTTVDDCFENFKTKMCNDAEWTSNMIKPVYDDTFSNNGIGVIRTCSDEKWDVNYMTPCLDIMYEPSDSLYKIQFIPKTCADPLEGSKYSNACAQR